MTKRRIHFSAWGQGDWVAPNYCYFLDRDYSKVSAVIRSIESLNGATCCAGPQDQGTSLDRYGDPEAHVYSFALGHPVRGGGYSPIGQVWVSIPVGQ